jgi:hypothetical protein
MYHVNLLEHELHYLNSIICSIVEQEFSQNILLNLFFRDYASNNDVVTSTVDISNSSKDRLNVINRALEILFVNQLKKIEMVYKGTSKTCQVYSITCTIFEDVDRTTYKLECLV